jgi:hypothetical protein
MKSTCTIAVMLCSIAAGAEPTTKPPRAARSVHLAYFAPAATAFYGEVTIEKAVPGSYFEVCGFNGGYFGIQLLGDGKKVGIFSVWDTATGNDPNAVAKKDRAETVFIGEGVRSSRFGGEGTGGHSDFDFSWNIGETYRFFLTSKIVDGKTEYAAYIFDPQQKAWFHVATFSAPNGGKNLTGLYSFIEDFRRNTQSATEVRRAKFGNEWVQDTDGKWVELTKAHFTASDADREAKDTINAGVKGKEFFLQTGGDTVQETRLNSVVERQAAGSAPSVPVRRDRYRY